MPSTLYPKQVVVNEQNIAKLTSTFQVAYKEMAKEIIGATNFGVANRKQLMAQIEAILTDLGVNVQEFIQTELPEYYKSGAADAVVQLNNIKAPIPVETGFNRIHKEAILALVDDTSRAFAESITGVGRSANALLGKATRDLITQKMAEGTIGGKALREVKQTIVGKMQDDGLAALIDKGGRQWQLDTYAEMLFRTKAVEARNRGLANRMVENDYDLVQVSSHGSNHAACAVWEGKILSLTGNTPGYPTIAFAESAGLFHPNCKHAINVIVPSLASKTQAYNPDTQTLTPAEAGLDE